MDTQHPYPGKSHLRLRIGGLCQPQLVQKAASWPQVLILLAALLDGLDGQVARRLGVVSPMGKELDSLADCVTFGVAPGYLAYQTYLGGTSVALAGHPIDLGILIAAVFPVCAAYRLARYNVRSSRRLHRSSVNHRRKPGGPRATFLSTAPLSPSWCLPSYFSSWGFLWYRR